CSSDLGTPRRTAARTAAAQAAPKTSSLSRMGGGGAGSTVVIRCLASADAVMGGGGRAGPGQHIPAGSERVQVLPRKVLVVAVSRLARSAGLLPVTRLSRMSLRSLTAPTKLLNSTMPPDSGEVPWLFSTR